MLYNAVLVSTVQKKKNKLKVYIHTSYPPGPSQSMKLSSLCYPAGSHKLPVLHVAVPICHAWVLLVFLNLWVYNCLSTLQDFQLFFSNACFFFPFFTLFSVETNSKYLYTKAHEVAPLLTDAFYFFQYFFSILLKIIPIDIVSSSLIFF